MPSVSRLSTWPCCIPRKANTIRRSPNLSFDQDLGEDVHVSFGKFNALDMFYALYPQTGRGINGFMNASMVIPLGVARVVAAVVHGRRSDKISRQEGPSRHHGLRQSERLNNQRLRRHVPERREHLGLLAILHRRRWLARLSPVWRHLGHRRIRFVRSAELCNSAWRRSGL